MIINVVTDAVRFLLAAAGDEGNADAAARATTAYDATPEPTRYGPTATAHT